MYNGDYLEDYYKAYKNWNDQPPKKRSVTDFIVFQFSKECLKELHVELKEKVKKLEG